MPESNVTVSATFEENDASNVEFSWSQDSGVTTGYSYTMENGKSQSGYVQDKNASVGLDLKFTKEDNSALFTSAPTSITLEVSVGGGSVKDPLENNVIAFLIDSNGNNIQSTQTTVTTKVENTTGKVYSVSMPLVNEAYGVRISHTKESGYNIRIYNMSFVAE